MLVPTDVSPQEIRAQLERLVASEEFSQAESLARLLRYIVTAAIKGDTASLKESVLGVEVFDRKDFDPRLDAIVRVQAGRLRMRLAAFYVGTGANDSIVVEIPKGTYAPTFVRRMAETPPPEAEAAPPRKIRWTRWMAVAGSVACGGLLIAAWSMSRRDASAPPLVYDTLTSGSEFSGFPAVSSDGSLVVMAAQRGVKPDLDLYLLQDAISDPVPLTGHEADDYDPAFSPDGKWLAFRSERNGGGVFVMPTLGSDGVRRPRLVAPGGRRPRFSPDGRWIAFWRGERHFGGQAFIVSSTGGEVRPVLPDFLSTRDPIWTPDGKHLLLIAQARGERDGDWWIAPVNGGAPTRTGVAEAARAHGIGEQGETGASRMTDEFAPAGWMPRSHTAVVALPAGESFNLWQVVLSPHTWKFERIERLTSGPGHHFQASVSQTGRLVMANLVETSNIYRLEGDPTSGEFKAGLVRVTDDRSQNVLRDVSADASTMVYHRLKGGLWQPIRREMRGGLEEVMSQSHPHVRSGFPALQLVYRVSADGSQIAFGADSTEGPAIFVTDRRTGQTTKVCDRCLGPHHWSADGHQILYSGAAQRGEPRPLGLVDPASGRRAECRVALAGPLWDFQVSPDGRWLAVLESRGVDRRRIWIVRCTPHVTTTQNDAIAITDGGAMDVQPRWSLDGRRLYYLSERDGFRCLIAQPLDPLTKHHVGTPTVIRHFHDVTLSLSNLGNPGWHGLTVTRSGIFFTLGEVTSNIWTAELAH